MSLTKGLSAALADALRRWGYDVRNVVDWRDVTRSGGGCSTCYWEEAGVDIDYIDSNGWAETYEYRGSFAELIRTLTGMEGEDDASNVR